ncbi:MAG TPA: hypothetical protein VM166_01465, partial [Gemmatimonadaceae bacterium]|nr:hypothetical protein [Gemmatimonadaceae bacterium]
ANLYSVPNPDFQNLNKAHRYWKEAERLLSKRKDEYALMQRIWLHNMHYAADRLAGSASDAEDIKKKADAAFVALSPLNPMRPAIAQQMAAVFGTPPGSGPSEAVDLQSLIGTWNGTLGDEDGGVGQVMFTPGFDRFHVGVYWSVERNGQLIEKATGSGAVTGRASLMIDWSGLIKTMGAITPATGTLSLVMQDRSTLSGVSRIIGSGSRRVRLKRVAL